MDHRDIVGQTSLFKAIKSHHVDAVRILLKHGAVVDQTMPDGDTALSKSSPYNARIIRSYTHEIS